MMEEDKKQEQEEMPIEEVQEELTLEEKQERKIKNLISAVILLAGLFVGSLFVDVAQLVRGGGFSQRILNSTDVFQSEGKTWVAYTEPIIKVQVVTDDACEACKPDEALLSLRRIIPTMLVEKVDVNSQEGKALLAKFEIKTIPALIFSKEVENTELYAQAQQFFIAKDGQFALKTSEVGLPVGKYVEGPKVGENDIQLASKEATVNIVEFTDFQNPSSKKLNESVVKNILKDYGDKVQFVFKQLPIPQYPQTQNAALASECANEQGKFLEYADKLFANQSEWGTVKDAKNTQKFKTYASGLGLNYAQFTKCLDEQQYKDKVTKDVQEGQAFGLTATPALFVGSELQEGGATYDDVKKVIEEQLAK